MGAKERAPLRRCGQAAELIRGRVASVGRVTNGLKPYEVVLFSGPPAGMRGFLPGR